MHVAARFPRTHRMQGLHINRQNQIQNVCVREGEKRERERKWFMLQ